MGDWASEIKCTTASSRNCVTGQTSAHTTSNCLTHRLLRPRHGKPSEHGPSGLRTEPVLRRKHLYLELLNSNLLRSDPSPPHFVGDGK